jgi:RNA polymerase sigma factor (sigma-70 family)
MSTRTMDEMKIGPAGRALQALFRATSLAAHADLSDAQLLERFIERQDETSFEMLVRRHGPMVLGVCRRALTNPHDADDAFQATFLVLLRKASVIRQRELLGNWLYGVAYRTAAKARVTAGRRSKREKPMPDLAAQPQTEEGRPDWQALLDAELHRLPEKYRVPVILCELEGRSRREVARLLDLPEGTLSSRLATARQRLARRLAGRGVALGATWSLLTVESRAGLPPRLILATLRAAADGAEAGVFSGNVILLTRGVIQTMLRTKLKFAVLLLVALGVVIAGARLPLVPAWASTVAEDEGAAEPGQPDPGASSKFVRKVAVADFTSVCVSGAFRTVEILQADTFSLTITADEGPLDFVKVRTDGATLTLDSGSTGWLKQPASRTLRAKVAMPALDKLTLSGASRVTLGEFRSKKAFQAELSGACKLEATIKAPSVSLGVRGASTATLKGSAKTGTISASGASSVKLSDLALERADVTLSGASSASVNVGKALDYNLNGACKLKYRGKPTIGKGKTSGASSVSPQ